MRRHYLHATVVEHAGRPAVFATGIRTRPVRHSFATHQLETSNDLRTVQELLGHKEVAAMTIYPHLLNRDPAGAQSPADRLIEG